MGFKKNNLPVYAYEAKVERVFKEHCSKCKTGRFFELNTDFPDFNTLRSAPFGIYVGTCLYCSNKIHDNYNWDPGS